MFKEFRELLQRGNVIDLAVAVVIGAAFGAIIDSFVNDILMPVIGLIIGGFDLSTLSIQFGEAVLAYGNFIQTCVNFLLISFALFVIVRGYNQIRKAETPAEPASPEPSAEEQLLAEIRDLLKAKS